MFLSLLCLTCLQPMHGDSLRASNAPLPDTADAYSLVAKELFPDELPRFEAFYQKLTPEGVDVFSRIVVRLDEGQRGALGLLLSDTSSTTADRFLELFDGFPREQFDDAVKTLWAREFSEWHALIRVLSVEEVGEVRQQFGYGSNTPCVIEPSSGQSGVDGRQGELPANISVCSAAIAEFREVYFPYTQLVTRGYVVGRNEALYQAQFSLFGPSTAAHKTRSARRAQVAQFGQWLEDWEINHTCGGVYLGDRFVLTAAHCVVSGIDDERFFDGRRIRLGSHSIDTLTGLSEIRSVISHRGYRSGTLRNDIALIELKEEPDSSRIRKVRLPPRSDYLPRSRALLVTGWGFMRPTIRAGNPRALDGEFQEKASNRLRGGRIQVFPASVCTMNRVFRRESLRILPGQLCAGSRNGVDTCRGDRGGPLVETETNTLIGLVSGGKGCGLFNTPSMFVDVAYYLGWIERAKRLARRSVTGTRRTAP